MNGKIVEVIDISTTPEFEILFLINEDLFEEYINKGAKEKTSMYYKKHNRNYNKQSSFIKSYFNNMTEDEIKHLIDMYVKKHGKIHSKHQKTLLELIKK